MKKIIVISLVLASVFSCSVIETLQDAVSCENLTGTYKLTSVLCEASPVTISIETRIKFDSPAAYLLGTTTCQASLPATYTSAATSLGLTTGTSLTCAISGATNTTCTEGSYTCTAATVASFDAGYQICAKAVTVLTLTRTSVTAEQVTAKVTHCTAGQKEVAVYTQE